jgi:hypothetical protein
MNDKHQEQNWLCQHCQVVFKSKETYSKHLADVRSLSAEQIAFLLQLGVGSAGPLLFQSCCFCEDSLFPDGLDSHMAQHLRQYALLSLPWTVDSSLPTPANDSRIRSAPLKTPKHAGEYGIELVGIVLAVYGALIKSVEGYNEVVTGRDVNLLLESLRDNRIMFLNSVECLLRSVSPMEELTRLLNDPMGSQWEDDELRGKMITHMGQDAENILQKIGDIHKTLALLQKKLPVSPVQPVCQLCKLIDVPLRHRKTVRPW